MTSRPDPATSERRSRPLPANARWLTEAELQDGVRLATGTEHVLVVPGPRLVLVGPTTFATPTGAPAGPNVPANTFWITHAAGDGAPLPPDLAGFEARIEGVAPDPTATTTFMWTLSVVYATGARADRQLRTTVEYTVQTQGGRLPADVLRRAAGRITRRGTTGDPDTTRTAGGSLTVRVAAVVRMAGSEVRLSDAREGYWVLGWDNPSGHAVRQFLAGLTDAREAQWFTNILCTETAVQQFSRLTIVIRRRGQPDVAYRRRFHPLTNNGGDGGVGMGQLTDPRATQPQTWDWRENVRAALAVYRSKARAVDGYVATVRRAVAGRPDQSTRGLVRALADARRAAGLPSLDRLVVPDLDADQRRESMARAYNGLLPDGKSGRYTQFGTRWHEFRLATVGSPTRLEVANERQEGTERVADVIWTRVPEDERPQIPGVLREYVQHVRMANCQ